MNTVNDRLAALQKQMNNRSPKPFRRLMASLAFREHAALIKSLPGSTKRGLARGKAV